MTTPDQTPEPIVITPGQACMGRTDGTEEATEPPTTYERFLEAACFAGVDLKSDGTAYENSDGLWEPEFEWLGYQGVRAFMFGWLFCQLRENGIEVSTQFTDDGRLYFVLGLKGQLKIGQVEYDELGALLSACEADWK